MRQPIEQRGREFFVTRKDRDPFRKSQVGRDDRAAALVAVGDQIEEQLTYSARSQSFERERVRERVRAELARARKQGQTLGRLRITGSRLMHLSGRRFVTRRRSGGVSKSTAARRLASGLSPGGTNLP
jgi:hypothetical protein